MNNYINSVQLVGHLGQDPEIKSIGDGASLIKMSLATNETYKDKKGEFQVKTLWHNLTAWRGLADHMAKNLKKGSHILVNGKINYNEWEAKDGSKRYGTEIVVQEYMHIDRKKSEA